MTLRTYSERLKRCGQLMKAEGLNVLLLTKPSNMFYLTGDGQVLKSFGVPMSHLDLGRISILLLTATVQIFVGRYV
jgi:Xaa-Pro aminopeptidase